MLRTLRASLAALILLVPLAAGAVQPDEILKDPALEARARGLSSELRCLVCQNQSIDDSDAPLARDLRVIVRERIQAGDTDREVLSFVVNRYGDFVLLRPPLNAQTMLLWFAPALVLTLGGLGLLLAVRRRRRAATPALSAQERAALDEILRRS